MHSDSSSATQSCNPDDIALKSFFLGPQAENEEWVRRLIEYVFERWFSWRRSLFPKDGCAISPQDQKHEEFRARKHRFHTMLNRALGEFENEMPKFSPRYMGHMVSEISLPALFGHIVALLHNPNNISGESSRVGIKIEQEAIQDLLEMIGYDPSTAFGHFTSGGTIANFEAAVRARQRLALWLAQGIHEVEDQFTAAHMGWEHFDRLQSSITDAAQREAIAHTNFVDYPWETAATVKRLTGRDFRTPVLLVPQNKHYSWQKAVSLLGLGVDALWPIAVDSRGRQSVTHLNTLIEKAQAEQRSILMVVSVAGSTELGSFDPIDEVNTLLTQWREQHGVHIWHHVDAAYGGFFCTLDRNHPLCDGPLTASLDAIATTNSVTLDPHKLGYVPYACGTILVHSMRDYNLSSWHPPYIQFKKNDRGPFTLEGSRSATGPLATWMIAKSVGFNAKGYGRILARTIQMREKIARELDDAHTMIRLAPHLQTNIIAFHVAHDGESLAASNARTQEIYRALSPEKNGPFIVSKTELSLKSYERYLQGYTTQWHPILDDDKVLLIRMCLMNVFLDAKEMNVTISKEFISYLLHLLRANLNTSSAGLKLST